MASRAFAGFGALWLAAFEGDAEFDLLDGVTRGDSAQAVEDLTTQSEELLLPDGVLNFNHQGLPDQRQSRSVGGDGFTNSGRPNGAREVFFAEYFLRGLIVLDEKGGAFHG